MQSRADKLPEMLKKQLLACRARIEHRVMLFPESIFTVDQLGEWVAILQVRDDESGISDVFDAILQALEGKTISMQDGLTRVLHRFIYQARILQLENDQLDQLKKYVADYASPEHHNLTMVALRKIECICSLLPALSERMLFEVHVLPLLDSQPHHYNAIKSGITVAALFYRDFMRSHRNEMISLIMRYIDNASHDQRELVCSLLNNGISLLSASEKIGVYTVLDRRWDESKGCRPVEQIIFLSSVWSEIPSYEKKRFTNLIYKRINKRILSHEKIAIADVLPLQMIWSALQLEQQLFFLRFMASQSRSEGGDLLQYHQFAPLILLKIDACRFGERNKMVVSSLFKATSADFQWNSHWYRAFIRCASLFSESDVLAKLNELCDYIGSVEIDSVEYVDALKLLSPLCLRLSSVQRAKFINKLLASLGELSLPAVSVVVNKLIALLVPDMDEGLRQIIFAGLLARPQHSLVDLCYRVCQTESVYLNQEQWCQFIAASIDSFVQPHQSKTTIIEAIVQSFNQLIYRSDKESVLSRLLDPSHDWKRERYLPCLLLRMNDALTHAQRDHVIDVVIEGFVKNGDWTYESIASHALMAVIPHLSTLQLMQILMRQFKTTEPVPTRCDAYELYLRVFREYEARLFVKDSDSQSYLSRLPAELQNRIRDYLNPPVDQPLALAGINP